MISYLSQHANLNVSTAAPALKPFVIFSGGSAGGVGVFTNYEYVASKLPFATVVGAPVGGFPPEIEWYTGPGAAPPSEDLHNGQFKTHNELFGSFVNKNCARALGPDSRYLCGIPYLLYPHLQTPLFVIEAITDSVVMCGFEGLDCTPKGLISKAVWGYINQYGHNATKNFAQINPKRDGLFAPSCLLHTGFLVDKPLLANMSAGQALFAWAQQYMPRQAGQVEPSEQDKGGTGRVPGLEGPFIFMDSCSTHEFMPPCNHHCPPITQP